MVLFGRPPKEISKEEKKMLEQLRKDKAIKDEEEEHSKLKAEQEEIEEVFDEGADEESPIVADANEGYYDALVSLVEKWLETNSPEEIALELERVKLELIKFMTTQDEKK